MKTAEIITTHLYRMRMKYRRGWSVELGNPENGESQLFSWWKVIARADNRQLSRCESSTATNRWYLFT
jgi:hypothetical protein